MVAVITNSKHALRWERVDPRGPRYGALGAPHPLLSVFFARLDGWQPSATDSLPIELENFVGNKILACNGWVWGGDPQVNLELPIDVSSDQVGNEYAPRHAAWKRCRNDVFTPRCHSRDRSTLLPKGRVRTSDET